MSNIPLSAKIFDFLIYELGCLDEGLKRPSLMNKYTYEYVMRRYHINNPHLVTQSLRRMENNKMIQINKNADELLIQLTELGNQTKELRNLLNTDYRTLPQDMQCIVSYDIPEAACKMRRSIRTLLRQLGFQCVHKSVWVCNLDISAALQKYLQKINAMQWFSIYIGRKI
ncbi:MAG: CRISPR-associated endonuclease Cas2 [Patescibacteria group bacterium]